MESEPEASAAGDSAAAGQEPTTAEPSDTRPEDLTVVGFELLEDGTVGGHKLPEFFD